MTYMIKKKKAVIYVRVSDIKQLEGVSLGHQEDKTTKYMELEDYEVVMVFKEEGRSAKDQWRDEFQNMMKYIRENKGEIDAVCFYALSRLGRNVRLVLETIDQLNRMKVAVYSYSEKLDTTSSQGKFTLTILSALAQLESDQIRERVMPNMRYSVENEGRWMGARYVPYGYESKALEDETNETKKPRKHLVVIPEQAEIVKLIFNLYCEGIGDDINAGQFKIAKWMNENGYRYKDGSEWTSKRVYDILKNGHLYAGFLIWNRYGSDWKMVEVEDEMGNITDKYEYSKRTKTQKPVRITFKKPENEVAFGKGIHKAIITELRWEHSKAKLEANSKKVKKENLDLTRQAKHLFTHVIVCPTCKGPMGASTMTRKNAKGEEVKDVYYKCQKAARGGMCKHNLIKEEYFKEKIEEVAIEFYRYYMYHNINNMVVNQLMFNQDYLSDEETEIKSLQMQREMKQKQIDDLYVSYKIDKSPAIPNEETYLRLLNRFAGEIDEIDRQIKIATEKKKESKLNNNEIKLMVEKMKPFENVQDYYNNLTSEGKMDFLSEIIYEIHIDKEEGRKGPNSLSFNRLILYYKFFDPRYSLDEDISGFYKQMEDDEELESKYDEMVMAVRKDLKLGMFDGETELMTEKLAELGGMFNIQFYDEIDEEIKTPNVRLYFLTSNPYLEEEDLDLELLKEMLLQNKKQANE